MGVVAGIATLLGIKETNETYFDDDDYLDEDIPEEKKPSKKAEKVEETESKPVVKKATFSSAMKERKIRDDGMEVCVFKPTCVADSREIVTTLRSDRIVTLNLEGIDIDIAQRILDYVGGATFAMDGNLQKLSQYMFLITPATVSVSGDMQNSQDEDSLDDSLR